MRIAIVICLVGLFGLVVTQMIGKAQTLVAMDMASAEMPLGHCADCGSDAGHDGCGHTAPCCAAAPERKSGMTGACLLPQQFPLLLAWTRASLSPGIELQPPRILEEHT